MVGKLIIFGQWQKTEATTLPTFNPCTGKPTATKQIPIHGIAVCDERNFSNLKTNPKQFLFLRETIFRLNWRPDFFKEMYLVFGRLWW